jgi:serine/threonine protein kinase
MPDLTDKEESLFTAALEIPQPAEREAFLNRACADDPALLDRVKRLLDADAQSERVFAGCISSASHLQDDQPPLAGLETDERPGAELSDEERRHARIARYKLLQRLGEGGCGVVYMAEQQEPVRRRVAVKVIKLGMDTKNVIARFEAERQALAMMEHPNIARVLDAGATETGRPYFVMELVRGVRITEFCDQRQLDIRQRLDLFIQICHAIQHAHQKGIIHRDIKPSNILVTLHDGVPVPKVIDFGIAKATEGRLTDNTLFTAYDQFVGTPAYMSPEQAQLSGLDIDTRSDIYSLGVLLYELLTGRTPFDSKELIQSGLDNMRRTLREEDPHRPSTRLNTLYGEDLTATATHRHVEPTKLKSLLHGDLDWIVMKALEKDRDRRYATANGLAADIERYLNNDPVYARPPSRIYRFQKLVRRNQAVFTGIAAVVLALMIGLGAATFFYLREKDLRHGAETREKVAQAALLINQGKFAEADELAGHIEFNKPGLENSVVLRSLGEWNVLNREWSKAANRLAALQRVNERDSPNTTSLDFLRYTAVLLELGDTNRLRKICEASQTRFAQTERPTIAERILMANLLASNDADNDATLRHFADLILPKTPVSIRIQPLSDSSLSVATPYNTNFFTNVLQTQLHFTDFGTGRPFTVSNADNTLTINAGGSNIYDTNDSFFFAHLTVTNDFDYRLRVQSVADVDSDRDNIHRHFSRAGLMARDSLTDNASHEITVAVNSGNTFQNLYRAVRGGSTSDNNALWPAHGSNSWVRLQRIGAVFYTFSSSDGNDWTPLFQLDTTADPDGPFANPVQLGIAVCAHSFVSNTTAVVSDLSVTPTVPINRTIALALLEYRRSHYDKAIEWCHRGIGGYPNYSAARVAAAHAILAMSLSAQHQTGEARSEWQQASLLIERKFSSGLDSGDSAQGYWFDWILAKALLDEAADASNSN